VNWRGYIVLAGSLAGQPFEASKRSAISRAYYGAFNHARHRLEEGGTRIDNHRAHKQVWLTFRAADQATLATKEKWQTVGELGGALRSLRNQADYADVVSALDRQATAAVETAERIILLLHELRVAD
jgi:hypothetical protein